MRSLLIILCATACTLTIDTPFSSNSTHPEQQNNQITEMTTLSGTWSLVSSTEEHPPTALLILRMYTSVDSDRPCPSMTASVANIHEVLFYSYYDLCYNGETITSTYTFPYVSNFYVVGRFTLHPGIQTTECEHNPTRVDCVSTDDYYILTLDLYRDGIHEHRRVYQRATPLEVKSKIPYTLSQLYDERGALYEFFLDTARDNNFLSDYCPLTKRALFRVDSEHSSYIPFEIACVADDNTFFSWPYEEQDWSITGEISKDLRTITYHTPDGETHTLTQ